MKTRFRQELRNGHLMTLIFFVVMLSACARGPEMVNHAFGFATATDSPNYEVLAYRYGQRKGVFQSSDESVRRFGKSNQWTGANGPMPLGDSLYVKWRNRNTRQVFEKTVNLKPLLPKDMTHQRIHFVVAEGEIFIFLKDMNQYAKPSDPIIGPFKAQIFVTRQIYP